MVNICLEIRILVLRSQVSKFCSLSSINLIFSYFKLPYKRQHGEAANFGERCLNQKSRPWG